MKNLMVLWQATLANAGVRCCVSSTALGRDLSYVQSRVRDEGELQFLAVTMPTFGKGFQRALERGSAMPSDFPAFASLRGPGSPGFPKFLRGFLALVFDSQSGILLDDPSIEAIQAVRQLTLMFSKVLNRSPKASEQKAFDGFVDNEKVVKQLDGEISQEDLLAFSVAADVLFHRVFLRLVRDVDRLRVTGRHGPGATADRLLGNQKWDQREWTWRLEEVFPSSGMLLPNDRHFRVLDSVRYLEPGEERPVRVTAVPKTFDKPRIIAIEPTCNMFIQQAIAVPLKNYLESDRLVGSWIGFRDQPVNNEMARIGSLTGAFATLDLSDASDRVSNQLVRAMFAFQPRIAEAVDACRSRTADVPGHGVLRLAKFASMGSALTFPIEAMVFLTIVFLAIAEELKEPLTEDLLRRFRGRVRVFGDDIIVPGEFACPVVQKLATYGSLVNVGKSFWTGRFRESCGKEYYAGEDVSIVRVRRELPSRRGHVEEIISTVSLRNQMYNIGYWETARLLDDLLERLIPFPTVTEESPVLGKHTRVFDYQVDRECPRLHRPLVRGCVVSSRIPTSPLGGSGALMKIFTIRGDLPIPDVNHLQRAGRPDSVSIKIRWATPY